ncbi:hypothetical protein SLE2022_239900 [Rubroshorea leprosula]
MKPIPCFRREYDSSDCQVLGSKRIEVNPPSREYHPRSDRYDQGKMLLSVKSIKREQIFHNHGCSANCLEVELMESHEIGMNPNHSSPSLPGF